MIRPVLCFVAMAALGTSLAFAQDKSDQQLLKGTWRVVAGQAADNEQIVGDLLTFTENNELTIQKFRPQGEQKQTTTFQLDSTKAPKTIDVKSETRLPRGHL